METIKIIEKFQGQGMWKLHEEPWQKLIKLDEGIFTENQTSIEFKTTDGHTITADKTLEFEKDNQKISYLGKMKDDGGPDIVVDKYKSKKGFYKLHSFNPGSFFVTLTTDPNYQAISELPFEIDNIQFLSDNHIRYQNRQIVVTSSSDSQGNNKGANRGIQIESNINGGEGYTVTIYNMYGEHPLWGNNVQMTPKQMEIVSVDNQKVKLHGYGNNAMGGSFADYGLTIYYNEREPIKIILHMYDRNVDIEYFKSEKIFNQEPEIVQFAVKAATNFQNENFSGAKRYLNQIYESVKSNPEQLKNVSDFESLSKAFFLMISMNLSDDIYVLQMMISLGYLCVTKAISNDKENVNLYKDRLLLLRLGHEPFKYTVKSALTLRSDTYSPTSWMSQVDAQQASLKASDAIYKMEIADLELNPILCQQVDYFKQRLNEFNVMIEDESFLPERTKDEIVKKGIENHKILFDFLENSVIEQGDIDF